MADIDAKTWLESVTLDEDNMSSNSADDVCTQQSIKAYADARETAANAYTDSEIAALDFATEGYVDAGLALKQNTLTNGAETITSAEVSQIKNIDSRVIANTQWNVVSGLQGSSDSRIIDDDPSSAWTYAYIPLTNTFSTLTQYGYMHFWVWQDNGAISSEFAEIEIRIPIGCYYDGFSNPPEMNVQPRGIGTQKFNRIIASNNGSTNQVKFYLEIANNGDGILDLYCRDASDTMLPSLLVPGTSTSTLANITDPMPLQRGRILNNFSDGGAIKIDSNGDTSEPTFSLVAGVPQQIIYTAPIIDPSSVYPSCGPFDSTAIYDTSNNIFLEQPVIGMPQYWRITMHYSGKASNLNEGFYVRISNPISGFTRRLLATLPTGETGNQYLTFDVSTYADTNSLLPPLGTGLGGYQFWVESVSSPLTVIIKDVARFTSKF